jgi:Family of unknown function (DUF6338)
VLTFPDVKAGLTLNTFGLLIAFAWPGLVSLNVYRILLPARAIEWADALQAGLFYSVVNYVVFLPCVLYLLDGSNAEKHPFLYWSSLIVLVLVGPIFLPIAYRLLFHFEFLAKWLQSPFPTAFDYYFDRRKPCVVIVHLLDGTLVGGFWGPRAYASSFPNEGDLYFSHSCKVTADGQFLGIIEDTDGLLIRKDQYSFLELFKVLQKDTTKEASHARDKQVVQQESDTHLNPGD